MSQQFNHPQQRPGGFPPGQHPTMPPGPGGPQPDFTKRNEGKPKRRLWLWIPLAILLAIVVIAVAASAGDDNEAAAPGSTPAASSKKPSPKASEPPAEQTFKIGQPATDGDYRFTVVSAPKCGVKRVGDQYSGEKAQGQYCIVPVKVKNVGDAPITFSSENQQLVDNKGKSYSPSDEAWIYLSGSDVYKEINPGNTLKTRVVFDISKKTQPDYLLLKAGSWGFSEGVKVML